MKPPMPDAIPRLLSLPALLTFCLVISGCREGTTTTSSARWSSDPAADALARRQWAIAKLQAEGVPTLASLPVIENTAQAKLRSKEEVVRRAIALWAVYRRAKGFRAGLGEDIIANHDFTPAERAFLSSPSPPKSDRNNFSWRCEALYVLLWSAGLTASLDQPTALTSIPELQRILSQGPEQLLAKAKPRSVHEILDQADLIYRYHWAVRNAKLEGQPPPAGLSADVIVERHHALNWLIGYMDQAWDDVSTDT